MMNEVEIAKCVELIETHADCIAWHELGDGGNPCLDWQDLSTEDQEKYCEVKRVLESKVLRKNGDLYPKINRAVSAALGSKVYYSWLITAIARFLSGINSYEEFCGLMKVSRDLKKRAQAK